MCLWVRAQVLLSAVVFYWMYSKLLSANDAMAADLATARKQLSSLEMRYAKLSAAAGTITVGYTLDKLVDKDLLDFSTVNSRPGLMVARPRD